jgi:GT2 family glycosyltransferase
MANSTLPSSGLPGPALLGLVAGACVIRKDAFVSAGGYEPKFFIGVEEALLALDLIADGWSLVYVPTLTVHHHPSRARDSSLRDRVWRHAPSFRVAPAALLNALREMPWVWRQRRVRQRRALPRRVIALYKMVGD